MHSVDLFCVSPALSALVAELGGSMATPDRLLDQRVPVVGGSGSSSGGFEAVLGAGGGGGGGNDDGGGVLGVLDPSTWDLAAMATFGLDGPSFAYDLKLPSPLAVPPLKSTTPPAAPAAPPAPRAKYSAAEEEIFKLIPKHIMRGTRQEYRQHKAAVKLTPSQKALLSKMRRRELSCVYAGNARKERDVKFKQTSSRLAELSQRNTSLEQENALLRQQLAQLLGR